MNHVAARIADVNVRTVLGILVSLVAVATPGCHDSITPVTLTVTAVSPDVGPVVGGTSVTLTGVNFIDVTRVTIGGAELADWIVVSTIQITGTTPPGANSGPADVIVRSSGQGNARCMGCFGYEPLAVRAQPIAAGPYHTCALASSGEAYCWGQNGSGQLGDGSAVSSSTPVAVVGGLTFGLLAAGGMSTTVFAHTCGVTSDGAAYCWGDDGNLGNESVASSSTPVAVSGGLTFSVLVAASSHTCGLTRSGAAYCWGDPENDNSYAVTPLAVSGELRFSALAAGGVYDCGLATGGTAYCWGYNESGQLGVGTTAGPQTCRYGPCSSAPVPVATSLRWASITAGGQHTCGLTPGGEAYCWGSNLGGQLGVGTMTGLETCHFVGGGRVPVSPYDYPCSSVPVPVATRLRWAFITARAQHTCGITTRGEAYCWGSGPLGNGPTGSSSIPTAVSGDLRFTALVTGIYHTCGLTSAGALYCWGANGDGQLGDGTTTDSSVPVKVALLL